MKILAIETSCDETAVAILEAEGSEESARFRVLGNALLSQIDIHREYGGVFPALAKREHAKNLVPLLEAALEEAELLHEDTQVISSEVRNQVERILEREADLGEAFLDFISESERPALDAIAVVAGPGLEPALWVGINFAKVLSLVWDTPLVAVNHMEGHVMAALASRHHAAPPSAGSGVETALKIKNVALPVLALLISGGHTELVLMKEWLSYELIGQTRDDAVGEAFDKVARMLALPYPGGPEISRLAEMVREQVVAVSDQTAGFGSGSGLSRPASELHLPRPMIGDATCDFSFAGLKTAVLYMMRDNPDASEHQKKHIAHEFENAVADVLWKKTSRALQETGARTLVIGGGVSANTHIRRTFRERIAREHPETGLRIPEPGLTTDNAVMVALAGFYRAQRNEYVQPIDKLVASGNLSLVA